MSQQDPWTRFQRDYLAPDDFGYAIDVSRMAFPEGFLDKMEPAMQRAFDEMAELESGAIANPDEGRQVGHYWLRNPKIAPTDERRAEVTETLEQVKRIASDVETGRLAPPGGGRFDHLLVIGIGGSALGPQLARDALGSSADRLQVHFFDNTDPDGMDRVISGIGADLPKTLVLVISKSGGTKETRNGMLEAEAAFSRMGLSFPRHAIAITGVGSQLDRHAEENGWLARVPMFDYVGGRTSEFSAVGLLPAAMQGIDIDAFLSGARRMDEDTRARETRRNPAALLALAWHHGARGRGERDMVILPYKDRLELFSRYLQQLVMESLGKELDRDGKQVHQGLAVYGNKGSTDQHAYVQQLRDGVNNFFAVFINVLHERDGERLEVEPGVTSGDYLLGFLLGTRAALWENGRESVTITVPRVDAYTLGMLIALFERTVGFYASLVNINAYHQPGVEAGKKAAGAVLELRSALVRTMQGAPGVSKTAAQWAEAAGQPDEAEHVWHLLVHLVANDARVKREGKPHPAEATFSLKA